MQIQYGIAMARPKPVVITVRLEPDVADWLDGLAKGRGVTSAVYIRDFLNRNFARRSGAPGPAAKVRVPADRREVTTHFKKREA
jgi:hypothetical protein